jgi:hypothetical protein
MAYNVNNSCRWNAAAAASRVACSDDVYTGGAGDGLADVCGKDILGDLVFGVRREITY